MYPPLCHFRRTGFAIALAAVSLAGCGGGGGPEPQAESSRRVAGPGFSFRAPASWVLAETPRSASASGGTEELVSVTVFPLVKPFRPSLWPQVVGELDQVAAQLADRLGGAVSASETVRIAGLRGRRYEIAYEREGTKLRQRIAFLLRRSTEYQLLCRWEAPKGEPGACALLEQTFRPA